MWGIITVWFCLMANAPYFPRVGGGFTLTGALEKCSLLIDRLGRTCTSECYIKVENRKGGNKAPLWLRPCTVP